MILKGLFIVFIVSVIMFVINSIVYYINDKKYVEGKPIWGILAIIWFSGAFWTGIILFACYILSFEAGG